MESKFRREVRSVSHRYSAYRPTSVALYTRNLIDIQYLAPKKKKVVEKVQYVFISVIDIPLIFLPKKVDIPLICLHQSLL